MTAQSSSSKLEQLLTHYIGPLAKIVVARARKNASSDQELIAAVAGSIDDEGERAEFLKQAGRIAPTAAGDPAPPSSPRAPAAAPPAPPARSAPPAAQAAEMKAGAIFVSYARENLPVAQRIVDALREAGLEVWLDMGKLQPGDAWDLKIRRNIEACSFFVALISRETDSRREGYFRREWNLAADRALNFSDEEPFLVPVVVDDTPPYSAKVPERFRRAHWISLPGGAPTPEFIESLKQLVDAHRDRAT